MRCAYGVPAYMTHVPVSRGVVGSPESFATGYGSIQCGGSLALIEDALDRLLPGRTTLIIAHRLSTIRRATKILYIEDGRVRETGTHADLIAAGGAYANLHAAQFAR